MTLKELRRDGNLILHFEKKGIMSNDEKSVILYENFGTTYASVYELCGTFYFVRRVMRMVIEEYNSFASAHYAFVTFVNDIVE